MSGLFEPAITKQRERRINIRVTSEEKEWIDAESKKNKSSASDIIREALRLYKVNVEGDENVQS